MFVCLCNRISEAEVRAAVAAGAGSVRELSRSCGAGAGCGACWDDLRGLLCEGGAGVRAPCAGGSRPDREQETAKEPAIAG